MALPPWFEEFAGPARAWYYPPGGAGISNTPLWIILTYSGCMLAVAHLPFLAYQPRERARAVIE